MYPVMSQFLPWLRSPRACRSNIQKSSTFALKAQGRLSCLHFRRYNSTHPTPSPSRRRVGLLAALGGGSLVAAYLFWPSPSRAAPTRTGDLLSPAHFTPVQVVASESSVDPDTKLITLAIPPESLPSLEESAFTPIWSIYVKDDDIQVERAYTPLEGVDSHGRMKFWIKKYATGEVGRWLHSKRPGDVIEIRGPLKTWPWRDGQWDEIIMVRIVQLYPLLPMQCFSASE